MSTPSDTGEDATLLYSLDTRLRTFREICQDPIIDRCHALLPSPDGRFLATQCHNPYLSGPLHVIDCLDGSVRRVTWRDAPGLYYDAAVGDTVVSPFTNIAPKLEETTLVALVEVQCRVVLWPGFRVVWSAVSCTVGAGLVPSPPPPPQPASEICRSSTTASIRASC